MKKYRDKKSIEDQSYRKNESERINAMQKKKRSEMTPEELDEKRIRHREYMKARRLAKKANAQRDPIRILNRSPLSPLSPKSKYQKRFGYRSRATLSKAVNKVLENTSESPSKKTSAVKQVAAQCGIKVVEGGSSKRAHR